MAIDPDVQVLLDTINNRLDAVEASGGNVDLTAVNARLDEIADLNQAAIAANDRINSQMLTMTDAERIAFLNALAP